MFRSGPHSILAMPLAALAITLAGCDSSGLSPVEPADALPEGELSAVTSVPVFHFPDGAPLDGSSKLVRTPTGVNYQFKAEGLTPGYAYTLWVVIFNNRTACAGGGPGVCTGDDVVNAAARPGFLYGAGSLAGGSGEATFAGRRTAGDGSGSANAPVGLPAFGLESSMDAEIHLVVHEHGPKNPAWMPDMIQSLDGGCTDAGVPFAGAASPWNDYAGPPAGAFAQRGDNICSSVQFAVHLP